MIGIVLVTHNNLADEFMSVVEHIMGPQESVEKICIAAGDDMDMRRNDIIEAVKKLKSEENNEGVAILTDMFGGTPSNLAISVMDSDDIEVLTGINLPMLIKLFSVRSAMPLSEAVLEAQESGRKYINVARNLLKS